MEDVQVADPQEGMSNFRATLAHVVTVPKITRDRKQASPQPKKKRRKG
jgi:hypothetical protein